MFDLIIISLILVTFACGIYTEIKEELGSNLRSNLRS